jgi:hypothetical protein
MVCYVYDCNNVKVIPMKSRSASEWVKAYDTIHQELTVKGFKPELQTLDNEASAALKKFFTINDVDYQLVVKLLPLPQPSLRARTDARTNPSAQRATQLGVCSRACTLSQDRTKLLLLSHNFINVMINSTSLNDVFRHY